MTGNTGIDKYRYSGYGIGFDIHGNVSFLGTVLGRNVIIFGVDMSSSTTIDNRIKDILILSKGPTQWLEHALSAEKMYSINFTKHNKKLCLSFHYNVANRYLFVNGKEIHKFNAKYYEIVPTHCSWNISKTWWLDNLRKTGLNGYVYNFSADYDAAAVDDILNIYNHLMKKNDILW